MKPRLDKSIGALATIALMTAAAPAMAQEKPGEGKSITLAQPTWDTGWFQTEIFRQMLQELGYEVPTPMTLDNPAFYQAVGFGDVDLWVDGWFPIHDTYRSAFEGTAQVVDNFTTGGALEGYLVDKATAEKMGITSLADFKRDDVKEAFDRNGDGKADMVACPPGWGCETVIEHHLDAYDLRDDINPVKAGYAAAMADAVAAYESGEPILFYTWTPNWTVNELVPGEDVVWIEVPEVSLPEEIASLSDSAIREDVEGCVSNPCRLGFVANSIVSVANNEFLEENPPIRALLEATEIELSDVYAQNARMNAGDTDVEAHASEWIEENRAEVDEWLDAARAAAK